MTESSTTTTDLLVRADSILSLLRHRCESLIPWGTPGICTLREADELIGQLRGTAGASSQEAAAHAPSQQPTPQVVASLREFLSIRQAMIDVGGTKGPLDEQMIHCLAEMQLGIVERAEEALKEYESGARAALLPSPREEQT